MNTSKSNTIYNVFLSLGPVLCLFGLYVTRTVPLVLEAGGILSALGALAVMAGIVSGREKFEVYFRSSRMMSFRLPLLFVDVMMTVTAGYNTFPSLGGNAYGKTILLFGLGAGVLSLVATGIWAFQRWQIARNTRIRP